MPDSVSGLRRNSVPESLRAFLEALEEQCDSTSQDRARKLGKDPDARVASYDKLIADLDIPIEVTRLVSDAYGLLEQAREATHGQSDATTRVELSKLLLRIDEFFAKKA
jgi:hypothetical protein